MLRESGSARRSCLHELAQQIAKTTGGGRTDRRVKIAASTSTLRSLAEGGQLRRFSTLSVTGSRSSYGLVHDLASYLRELAMLMLAHRT